MDGLRDLGIVPTDDYGWCYKATYDGRAIDFFFPERAGVDAPGYGPAPSVIVPRIDDEAEIAF
jgi:hypothetical protein